IDDCCSHKVMNLAELRIMSRVLYKVKSLAQADESSVKIAAYKQNTGLVGKQFSLQDMRSVVFRAGNLLQALLGTLFRSIYIASRIFNLGKIIIEACLLQLCAVLLLRDFERLSQI